MECKYEEEYFSNNLWDKRDVTMNMKYQMPENDVKMKFKDKCVKMK
jgi:hypothetical protein